MDHIPLCPSCRKPLAPDVPLGLCPECLLRAGFPTGVDSGGHPVASFDPPTVEELAPLFPQLEIRALLGKGGMGAVYQARQKDLDRMVALKILPPGIGGDEAFAGRFAREARALARLNHPGIVTLYEFGSVEGATGAQKASLYFFLMEFVDGANLRHVMCGDRIGPREALAIVPQICDALQYAHDQGVVHRDIKPENILLDRRGRVKVADFGLAKIVGGGAEKTDKTDRIDRTDSDAGLTLAGKVMGTPHYMSPEQIEAPGEVDHRADIYALGVVFYQMLTGELPGQDVVAPSRKVQLDVRLDEIVLRALEKKPELRYQQASMLKTQVETITEQPASISALPQSEKGTPLFPVSFGLVFRSRKALRLARVGWGLGCLGALGFLGSIPGWEGMTCLFGLCGFFGLIGLAVLIECIHRGKHGGRIGNQGEEQRGEKSEMGKAKSRRPAALSITVGVLGILSLVLLVATPAVGVRGSIVALVNIALLAGLLRRARWAYLLTIARYVMPMFVVAAHGDPGIAGFDVLTKGAFHLRSIEIGAAALVCALVVVPLLLCTRWFFGGDCAEPIRRRWFAATAVAATLAAFLGILNPWPSTSLDWKHGPFGASPSEWLEYFQNAESAGNAAEYQPTIDRVTVDGDEAIVEGQVPKGGWIRFHAGPRSNGFSGGAIRGGHFQASLWNGWSGLNSRLCFESKFTTLFTSGGKKLGDVRIADGTLVFRAGQPHAEADGSCSVTVAEWTSKSGEKIPFCITVEPGPAAAPKPIASGAVDAYREFYGFLHSKQPRELVDPDMSRKMGEMRTRFFDSLRGTKAGPVLEAMIRADEDQRRAYARGDDAESGRLKKEVDRLSKQLAAIMVDSGAPDYENLRAADGGKGPTPESPGTKAVQTGSTAKGDAKDLQFRWVEDESEAAAAADELQDPGDAAGQRKLRVLREVVLSGETVESATLRRADQDNRSVEIVFTRQGSQVFAEATKQHVGRQLAIVWRGRVVSAPVVHAAISGGHAMITGRLSEDDVAQLLGVLNHRNAEPVPPGNFQIIGPTIERVIEPTNPDRRALNLGRGDFLKSASDRKLEFSAEGLDTLRANGVDLYAPDRYLEGVLLTLDMRQCVTFGEVGSIDELSADGITNLLKMAACWRESMKGAGFDPQPRNSNIAKGTPYVFLTRDGVMGALQTNDDAKGVKIRYRLVQDCAATSSDDESTLLDRQPPVVVETCPASGATDVPAGEVELRVRFSKPMADGSWSPCTVWDGSTPPVVGSPKFDADHKTWVIRVKLEAGRNYGYWLNCEKFRNFTDRAGSPAVPYLLVFHTNGQADPVLRADRWKEDLEVFESELPKRHLDFSRLVPPEEFRKTMADLKDAGPRLSDSEMIMGLLRVAARTGVAHTQVDWLSQPQTFHGYPVEFRWFADGLAVWGTTPENAGALGARVARIGTMTPDQLEAALSVFISHENNAWLHIQSPTYMRTAEFLQSLHVPNADGTLDLTLVQKGQTSTLRLAAVDWVLSNRDMKMATDIVSLTKGNTLDRMEIPLRLLLGKPEGFYQCTVLGKSKTLYIQYSKCMNAPDLPFARFVEDALAQGVRDSVERVVVDLRANAGGDSQVIRPLLDGLRQHPEFAGKGRLYCLIGWRTFSSGVMAAMDLRTQLQAILVGEPTGGKPNCYGEIKSFRLPRSGIAVFYPTKSFHPVADGDPASLEPDVPVGQTAEDFFCGREPAVEAALRQPIP